MANYKVDVTKLQKIIDKTIGVIKNSKDEIYDIADNARKECERLEAELDELKIKVARLFVEVDELEDKLKKSRKKLMLVNKNYNKYSQAEYKKFYKQADKFRVELRVKREHEVFYIKRRNELEVRIKNAQRTVEKAENLFSYVDAALGYLTGDLQEVSLQLENMQQRQLLGLRIIKAQEEERQRVAREIHDGPAQLMSNIVMKTEICEKLIDMDIEKMRNELKNLKKTVRYSLKDVRKIIYNLRPMSLDDLGLIPTLQRYIDNFQEENGIIIDLKTTGMNESLSSAISLTVFRIVQEAINNVNKHAKADKIVIKLSFKKNELKLEIVDDGIGFNINNVKENNKDIDSGFGIINMKERVELLDGSFDIESEQGKGTRLLVVIPLIKNEVSY